MAGSCRPGGLPVPTRTRKKSPVPSEARIERSPLWPLSPPANFTRIVSNGMSSSSCTATRCSGPTLKYDSSALTGPPISFM